MKNKHPVIQLIEDIHNAKEIIADLYDSESEGALDETDPSIVKQIAKLTNLQLLIPLESDTYSLDSDFSRLIDKGLRQDTISYLNTDVGSEIKKIAHVFDIYHEAKLNDRFSVANKHAKDLRRYFRALIQRFNLTADELFKRVQANYGKMSYSEDKSKENAFYQSELEQLKESYHEVTKFLESELYQNDIQMINQTATFMGRTMGFVDRVTHTLSLLKEFAYKAREQERQTEILRALLTHLESHPTETFENSEDKAVECKLFKRPSESAGGAFDIKTFPNIDNEDFEEIYGSIIEKIKTNTVRPEPHIREESDIESTLQITKKRDVSVADKLLNSLLEKVHTKAKPMLGSDALNFDANLSPSPDYWLYFLRKSFYNNKRIGNRRININKKFRIIPIMEQPEGYSGNYILKNVIIAPKGLSDEQVNKHCGGILSAQ